jgi:transposase
MPRRNGAVHVATTVRRYKGKTYTTHLLRRSYRHEGKVKHQTLGNLSHLPPDLIDTIRRRLAGEGTPPSDDAWDIVRTLPHGHVAAVLGALENLGLDHLLASRRCRARDLAVAMIVARVIAPASKLATSRALQAETASMSLSLELGIGDLDEDELYDSLDWLAQRQRRIETKLAKKHLSDGTLVLYDVSSSYYTGRRSGLVAFGHNRDGKRRFPQIVYGLLCNGEGCPIAVEVFEGNTSDPATLGVQVQKVRQRFGIERVVWVGDRGLITSKRIEEALRDVEGLDWITALRADAIKKLASDGVVQPSLFDQRDLVAVRSPDFPGERLVVCRNPLLAEERARKREALLAATEKELEKIVAATRRPKRPLTGEAAIALRVGKVRNRFKVGKHFVLEITDQGFSYKRNQQKIDEEAALDGLYVIRTSVQSQAMGSEDVVRAYKDLSKVERAFRSIKTIDLKIRPIHHWLDERIKGHVFLCMLAYYVEWHMRQRLAPILFDDHHRREAEGQRKSIVSPAPRSAAARKKDQTKRTDDDAPVHSFRTLLEDLGTLAKNRVRIRGTHDEFYVLTQPTPSQARALDLLNVSPIA